MKKIRYFILVLVVSFISLFGTGLFLRQCVAENFNDYTSVVDFVVDVEEGRDIRVLQLSDPQIIDPSQQRYLSRLGANSYWPYDQKYDIHDKYVKEAIETYQPDLIIITGDVVYGEFDDSGKVLLDYIEFMDSFQIPWAPVFGNHDNESRMGVDWQCEQFENSEYCLFKQRELTGNGNYTVGLTQGGKLKRVFFMLDSNGCGGASALTLANGHTETSVGFGNDQIEWYTNTANAIKELDSETKLSFAFHIQLAVFNDAFKQYGFTNVKGNPINIDTHPNKADTDFGYLGRELKDSWDTSYTVWNGLKALGVDSIFVGHEHCNSASVMYQGVRLQYGQKSSGYDRFNIYTNNGGIESGYYDCRYSSAIMGGTAIPVSKDDGSIVNPYIVYADGKNVGDAVAGSAYFDFNNVDFNVGVSTSDINVCTVTEVTDKTNVPQGYEGGVYARKCVGSSDLLAFGFDKVMNIDHISAFKVRMYVENYTVSSGKNPLVRLYDNTNNAILSEMAFSAVGGKFGEWVEIDILSMLKSAKLYDGCKLQPFTFVFRYYTAQTPTAYCDSIIVDYTADIYDIPEDSTDSIQPKYETEAWATYNGVYYNKYTISDLTDSDNLKILLKKTKVFELGKNSFSVSFDFMPASADGFTVRMLCDENGEGGIYVTFTKSSFTIASTSTFSYTFSQDVGAQIEIGLIRFEKDIESNLHNGNTGYVFVKINGSDNGGEGYPLYWSLVELYDCKENNFISFKGAGMSLELNGNTSIEYISADGKLLMKEMAKGDIAVTLEKISDFVDGQAFESVLVDGETFVDGTVLSGGTHTVVVALNTEPNKDLFDDGFGLVSLENGVVEIGNAVYDGTENKLVPQVILNGNVLKGNVDYTLAYYRNGVETKDFINVGEITVRIVGKGFYEGNLTGSYIISKKALTVTALDQRLYNGASISQGIKYVQVVGLADGDSIYNVSLVKDGCAVKIQSISIENVFEKDVTANYEITFVDGVCHTFGEWVVQQAPTATEDGYKERACECGEKERETLLATGEGNSNNSSGSGNGSDKDTDNDTDKTDDGVTGCFGSIETSMFVCVLMAAVVLTIVKKRQAKENV